MVFIMVALHENTICISLKHEGNLRISLTGQENVHFLNRKVGELHLSCKVSADIIFIWFQTRVLQSAAENESWHWAKTKT